MAGYKIKLFFLLIAIFYVNSSTASPYGFSKLSVENGLSNNEVNAIYKDSFGFIWIGTLLGLDRFDGIEICSFANKFPDQIENVLSIEEDNSNGLWIGASSGIYRYLKNTDSFKKINIATTLPINVIKSVSDSLLFIGTNNGLFILNRFTEKSKHILLETRTNKKKSTNHITDIETDNHGNCWLATKNGLAQIPVNGQNKSLFHFDTEPQQELNSFTSLCIIRNKIYLGTSNSGVVEFSLDTKKFVRNKHLKDYIVTSVKGGKHETLYVGTNGAGLFIENLRTNEIRHIQKDENNPATLSSNAIYSFLLDKNERYWIGTYSGGVNYSNTISGGFQLHPVSTQYPSLNKSIRSFYFAPDGDQFFGTRNGFVHLEKNGKLHIYNTSNKQLHSDIILTVFPFRNKILLGTYGGGISYYNPKEKRIEPFLNSPDLKNGNTYAFAKDSSGNLWITSFNGIYRYSPSSNQLTNFNEGNSTLVSNQVFSLYIDSKNRLWAGTDNGLSAFKITGNKLQTLSLPTQFNNSFKINYIKEDQTGNIWVCSEIGGLWTIKSKLKSFKKYKQKDGLPDNSVCAIIENSPGSYWISTLKGFCHFSLTSKKFTNFSISDGLPGLVFTPGAVYLSENGHLWFGNENGLIGFFPEDVENKRIHSNIAITNLYIAGQDIVPSENSILNKPVVYTKDIELNYKSSNIGFRFVDLNYLSPFDNNYFIKLEGKDTEWHDNGNKNTVFYKQLKPGKYTFKVKNAVSAGEKEENTKVLHIYIKQRFTRSVFFWIGLWIILLAMVAFPCQYLYKLIQVKRKYLKEHEIPNKYQGSGLTEQNLKQIVERLKQHIKAEKLYLNADLKLNEVAKKLNIPSHHISQALNQVSNQNFSDFINKYRVREVRYMLENDALNKLTLMAIAEQCGFNSKTSFYRTFKKFTGKTPVEYLNSISQ